MKPLFALLALGSGLLAQTSNPVLRAYSGTPDGPCTFLQVGLDLSNGHFYTCPAGSWVEVGSNGGSSVPSGSLVLITSGSCSAGWTEAADLDGVTVVGTLAGHGDVGSTGGSDTITPAGSVTQPTLSMNSYTPAGSNSAPAFTGAPSQSTSAVSAGTPAGTITAPTFAGDVNTTSATSGGTPAGTNTSGAFTEGAISWPAGVPTAANESSHTHPGSTISWPAGVPTIAAGVFTQPTISWPAGVPTFSGNAFSSVINHTHNLVSTSFTPQLQGGTTASTTGTHIMTSTATGGSLRSAAEVTVAATPATGNPGGGVASITPGGTVAWPAGVPTNASGAFTEGAISWPAGVPTNGSTGAGTAHTHVISWPAGVPTIAPGVFTQSTFAGSALGTHTHTLTPTGTNTVPVFSGAALGTHLHTLTPAGTVAAPAFSGTPATLTGSVSQPSFSGNSADNRSAFIKAIFCRKN